jgi:hypothetical protein
MTPGGTILLFPKDAVEFVLNVRGLLSNQITMETNQQHVVHQTVLRNVIMFNVGLK